MLRIEGLKFTYGKQSVLNGINMSIEEKEFIGIIGPNGSGKSTLLRNISKHLTADSGSIYLDKRLLNDISLVELARTMSVVPQETTINYSFTVYDLVMMGRSPYQNRWGRITAEDKKEVRKALQLTDTMRFKDRYIDQLSGGERQRVIIARALAQKPEILLLDEPTASLDINYQQEVFDILSSLNKKLNLTILVVSHDLNLSSQYCDKLFLLKKGQIYASGEVKEVLTEKNIANVYQTKVMIQKNPLTDRPYVVMLPGKAKLMDGNPGDDYLKKDKIHLICGGGSGRSLLRKLYNSGFQLSCGVLNQGDSDWETAVNLNIEIVDIPPFSVIDNKSKEYNISLAKKADYIILAETPFGYGNLENLSILLDIDKTDIILYNSKPIYERDYTGGRAAEYWNRIIKQDNVSLAETEEELLTRINTSL